MLYFGVCRTLEFEKRCSGTSRNQLEVNRIVEVRRAGLFICSYSWIIALLLTE